MTSRPDSDENVTDIQTRNDRLSDDSLASRRGPGPTAGLGRETHTLTTHGDRQLASPVSEGPVSRQTRRGAVRFANIDEGQVSALTLQCITVTLTL